ncbi:GNAT family N-acetyltransferase [Streptomyces sp. NPDC096339]|uniref:GNAT family N-acetyltransferase n=1 Tax=Streptomyces sp. NPDC096339 TaxID=3366086 RepID=UPI0037FCF130
MEPITLYTERLVLRPHTPGDAAEVHAACQDPEIQRWISVPVPYEPAHAGMEHDGALLDCWAGALLPSDLGLPSRLPYGPAVSGAA